MILWWGFRGIHPAQMNSMVPRSHMGRLLCPKTFLKNKIYANSSKSEKLQVAPATSPWPSLFPFKGPCLFPLQLFPNWQSVTLGESI